MKKLSTLFAFLIMTLYSFAQKSADKSKIEGTIIKFFDGMSTLNGADLKAVISPDFILLEGGLVWNVDSLINHMAPLRKLNMKRVNKLVFINTEQNKDIAWLSYFNTAEFTVNDRQRNIRWLESAVLIKQNNIWKIKLLHSTPVKE